MSIDRALQPFTEAIDALRARLGNQLGTNTWRDIKREAHDRAFVVAGAMKADLLADLAAAVGDSINKGLGIEYFRKRFDSTIDTHGWAYTGARNWRTRVIYGTNLSVSQAAGRLKQLRDPDLQKLMPFWKYVHNDSVMHPRLLHVSWDGVTLPADHVWFHTHMGPNGFGCLCRVVAVTAAEAERSSKRTPPDDGTRTIDGREVPNGIDEGWDYMPGANAPAELKAIVAAKAATLPPQLAKAFTESMVPDLDAAIEDASKYVLENGMRRDIEYAAAIGKDGATLFRKSGQKRSVSFTDAQLKQLPGSVLVHNHPSSRSLSLPDMVVAGKYQLDRIIAVGHDGSRYTAVARASAKVIEQAHAKTDAQVFKKVNALVQSKAASLASAERWHHHILNSVLGHLKLIEYTYDGVQPPDWVVNLIKGVW